jgi:hypothetical protein
MPFDLFKDQNNSWPMLQFSFPFQCLKHIGNYMYYLLQRSGNWAFLNIIVFFIFFSFLLP